VWPASRRGAFSKSVWPENIFWSPANQMRWRHFCRPVSRQPVASTTGHPKPNHGGLEMPNLDGPCANQPGRRSARLDVTGRFCQPIQSVQSMAVLKTVRLDHSTVIPATKGELLSIADSRSIDRTWMSGFGFFQVWRYSESVHRLESSRALLPCATRLAR